MLRMQPSISPLLAIALGLMLGVTACGDGDASDATASSSPGASAAPASTVESTAPSATAVATTAAPTTAAPSTAPPETTAAPTPAPEAVEFCEGAGPLLPGTVIDSSMMLDVTGDGSADDLVETYDVDGSFRLRLTTGRSVVSEIVDASSDGPARPIGVAAVFPGDSEELFVVIGEDAESTEIGVFGVDDAECLFAYTYADTTDVFTMSIRPASPLRSGAFCFDGGIGLYSAERRDDGSWDAYSAAYEVATPGTVQYLGASDDFSEGLDESELSPFELDCFGLSL